MGQLDGKVAVVTGGGRGIGRAIARRYASEGAIVVISSRTGRELDEVLSSAGLDDSRGSAVVADAMDRLDVCRPVTEALETFGRVDILVNNVGGHVGGSYDAFDGDDNAFEQTLTLSLTSVWWTTAAALPSMRARRHGRIICIGSGASHRAAGSLPYASAKHALAGFVRVLASQGAPHGINVNLLCPGNTRTSLLDFEAMAARRGTTAAAEEARLASDALLHRILEPEELGGMATLLAGPDGSGITGQMINVDGGWRV